jgi:SAM-dependent methyltransferase
VERILSDPPRRQRGRSHLSVASEEGAPSGEGPPAGELRCPACGGPGERVHAGLRDRLLGAAGEWSLFACGGCGLTWLEPRPSPEALAALYAGYHTHAAPERPSWWRRAVRRAVPAAVLGYAEAGVPRSIPGWERWLGRVLAALGPLREAGWRSAMGLPAGRRGRMLDVGCGAGAFPALMRELGWDASGAEPDPAAAEVARRALGAGRVHTGTLEELGLPAASFDAITLSHVIEHLPDPVATLRECARLLRPGGCVALATPNTRSLARRRFGPDWRGWEPPRHLFLFDPPSLRRAAEAAGLRVLEEATPASAAYFVYAESAGLAAGRAPGWRERLAGLLFWLREHRAVRRGAPVGEEVWLLAERPAA